MKLTTLTHADVHAMFAAQATFTAHMLIDNSLNGYSDDDIDYTPAAMNLTEALMFADYDFDNSHPTIEQLRQHVAWVCGDGVCEFVMRSLFDDHNDPEYCLLAENIAPDHWNPAMLPNRAYPSY